MEMARFTEAFYEKKMRHSVKNLLNMGLDQASIATALELSLDFVEDVARNITVTANPTA